MTPRAQKILARAYDMVPLYAAKEECIDPAFPMYSFETPACIFWGAYIDQLVVEGLTDAQIEWLLRSTNMRHMLNAEEDRIEELARGMVTESDINTAKKRA